MNGKYPRSEETKKNMSIAQKKRYRLFPMSEDTKNKIRKTHIGLKASDETRRKQSLARLGNKYMLGKHLSEETKAKLSKIRKGNKHALGHHPIINEERKKQMSSIMIERWKDPVYKQNIANKAKERYRLNPMPEEIKQKIRIKRIGICASEETKKKMSEKRKGKTCPWLMGRHPSQETIEKMRKASTGKQPMLGKHHSNESKAKMSKNLIGNQRRKGIPHDEVTKKKVSHQHKNNPKIFEALNKAHKLLTKISKPQKELFFFIRQIFPDAVMEYPIKTNIGWCFIDIAIPSIKVAIEYDGAFWHKNKTKDNNRDKALAEIGWTTFRVDSVCLNILSKNMLPFAVNNLIEGNLK